MNLIDFFNHPFFIIVGGISTVLMIITFLYTAWLVITGVFPVWYRLGLGLSRRRIAIFAGTEYEPLKTMLINSKIFQAANIVQVHTSNLKSAENETLFLVHWKDYQEHIDKILAVKKDSAALIVYAPQNEGRIDQETLDKINANSNSIVVNLRGRLLNDILTSLITTSYDL